MRLYNALVRIIGDAGYVELEKQSYLEIALTITVYIYCQKKLENQNLVYELAQIYTLLSKHYGFNKNLVIINPKRDYLISNMQKLLPLYVCDEMEKLVLLLFTEFPTQVISALKDTSTYMKFINILARSKQNLANGILVDLKKLCPMIFETPRLKRALFNKVDTALKDNSNDKIEDIQNLLSAFFHSIKFTPEESHTLLIDLIILDARDCIEFLIKNKSITLYDELPADFDYSSLNYKKSTPEVNASLTVVKNTDGDITTNPAIFALHLDMVIIVESLLGYGYAKFSKSTLAYICDEGFKTNTDTLVHFALDYGHIPQPETPDEYTVLVNALIRKNDLMMFLEYYAKFPPQYKILVMEIFASTLRENPTLAKFAKAIINPVERFKIFANTNQDTNPPELIKGNDVATLVVPRSFSSGT